MLLSLRGISSRFQLLFPSQGQVLTRYSPVRHWKHHFPSDLHVLSMPPAFILSQDRTLHEIHSCITYSFLVRRQSGFGIVFHLSFISRHNLYPCASYSPGVRSQKYSHPCPLTSIPRASYPFSLNRGGGAKPNRKTHIGFRDNQARTDDFHHVKVTLYR